MSKSKPNQADTATRIINATLALIAEKGSDALRTREILERAEVSNLSAVSYYFGSLENLRRRALEQYFDGIRPVIASLNETDDPRAALLEYCEKLSQFVLAHPALERNIVALAMSGGEAASVFAQIVNQNISALRQLILRARPEIDPQKANFDAIALASATIYPLLLGTYGPEAGIDTNNEAQRESYFSNLVSLVLGPS